MAQVSRQGCWKFRLVCALVFGGAIAIYCGNYAVAQQIVPDATLGAAESSVVTPSAGGSPGDVITGGATRGANLFHSFEQFSVLSGRAAFFNNAANIQNIISRVTGSSVSNIDGLLGANGTTNVFLLNPNGIVFGPNATLNIGGSFLASTAISLNFADGTQFSATAPQTAPLLTVSVPIGLQFGGTAGSILNQSRATNSSGGFGLQVPLGKTLGLVGGNVSLEGGILQAPGGRVELGGAAGAGTVGLNVDGSLSFPEDVARADVYLTDSGRNNAEVNVAASNGGSIAITARNIDIIAGSVLFGGLGTGLGFPGAQAGDITLNATGAINVANSDISNNVGTGSVGQGGNINITAGSLSLTDGARLRANTFGQGNTGSVNINASDAVSFDGGRSAAFSSVEEGAFGNGGSVNITTGSLSLTKGAELLAYTDGQGNAGSVNINARDSISFDGIGEYPSGVFTTVDSEAVGNGGGINITTGLLSVTNGAQLAAYTNGQGDAGSVNINARDTVSFDGGDALSTVQPRAVGNGGGINITTGSLSVTNAAELTASTFGQGSAGDIIITARDRVSLDNAVIFSTVGNPVAGIGNGDGGDIRLTTGSLSFTNGAQLSGSTFARGDAGDIIIEARDSVSFAGIGGRDSNLPSAAFSIVGLTGNGDGGNISISSRSLSVTDGARLTASTNGQGDAGSVTITASDISFDGVSSNEFFSGAFSSVEEEAVGNGGGINITTESLAVRNGARLSASTRGQGDAGSVNINARDTVSFDGGDTSSTVGSTAVGNGSGINITTGSLSVTNGGQLAASTLGQGNAGSVNINARDTVSFDGGDAFSTVQSEAVGNGGGINITAGSLFLSNNALLSASTLGQGNAGSVFVQARDSVSANNGNILARVAAGAVGNSGDINVTTGSLSLTDGARLDASTRGQGNAGSVFVQANDSVSLSDSSFIRSFVGPGGVGNAGDIDIQTRTLTLTNGSQVSSSIIRQDENVPGGQGKGGNIRVIATDSVNLFGISSSSYPSALLTLTEQGARGQAGNITVTTGDLRVANSANVNAGTRNPSDGGNITINANTLEAANGGQVSTSSSSSGKAGNITLNVTNNVTLSGSDPTYSDRLAQFGENRVSNGSVSGLFASTTETSTGQGGSLKITTGQLNVWDGAQVTVSSQGSGNAGDTEITARDLLLNNQGKLIAETTSGQGGNITLQVQDLLLMRGNNSQISTTAGTAQAGGNGGNITINVPFLIAVPSENSDIRANAFTGNGGKVTIFAQGIFGTQFRPRETPRSDITASSTFGESGVVDLNTPDVDPSQGLVALPAELVDASGLIAQGCAAGDGETASQFTVTGRGGLPPNPSEPLSSEPVWEDARLPATTAAAQRSETVAATPPSTETANVPLVPATGWVFNGKGEVTLIAQVPNLTSNLASTPATCRAR